jgi:hypothetical protein
MGYFSSGSGFQIGGVTATFVWPISQKLLQSLLKVQHPFLSAELVQCFNGCGFSAW